MKTDGHTNCKRRDDRGVSILIIAVSMVFVLGMAGLGIDLASLYVGRSQAQRAADAAALAGAQALASDPSCVNGNAGNITSACQALARQQAKSVGDLNLIAGVSPGITDGDITFPSTSTNDPQVQVIAARDAAHNNPMPTFFVKIFGINTANVSAKAIAEAYSSNGQGPPVGARCVKPWLIPNCDPGNLVASGATANGCPSGIGGFVIPQSGGISSTPARDDTLYAPNGPLGETYTMKPGTPGDAAAPGQYYAAYIPNTTQFATECPACASSTTGGGGSGSAAVYRTNIECCNNNPIVCGSNNITLSTSAGNMVGPTVQGVNCLIHQSGSSWSNNCGQDRIAGNTNPCAGPYPPPNVPNLDITAGPNNPYLNPGDSVTSQHSDSVVALPIWDGTPLQSGQNPSVNIVGFLQLFIQAEDKTNQGTVYGTVMGVTACGDGSGGGSANGGGPIVVPGGSSVPVRLIHE